MARVASSVLRVFFLLIMMVFVGCATVPKEVVELSYTTGQDLDAIHSSYKNLIETHFDNLRAQTNDFLENRWIPVYLKRFMEKSELVKMVQGSDPKTVFVDVQLFVEVAIKEIEDKKKELIDPINRDEKDLMSSVDEAFSRIIRANAMITAHLNSLRKVQQVQDEALQALQLKDLQDKINDGLIMASEKSKMALEELKKTEGLIDKIDDKKKELLKKEREAPHE